MAETDPAKNWHPVRDIAQMGELTETAVDWMSNSMSAMGDLIGVTFQMSTHTGLLMHAAEKLLDAGEPLNFDREDRTQLRVSSELVGKTIANVQEMLRIGRHALERLETVLDEFDQAEADCLVVSFEDESAEESSV